MLFCNHIVFAQKCFQFSSCFISTFPGVTMFWFMSSPFQALMPSRNCVFVTTSVPLRGSHGRGWRQQHVHRGWSFLQRRGLPLWRWPGEGSLLEGCACWFFGVKLKYYISIPAQPKVLELLYRLLKCTFLKNTWSKKNNYCFCFYVMFHVHYVHIPHYLDYLAQEKVDRCWLADFL